VALQAPGKTVLVVAGGGVLPLKVAEALGGQASIVALKGFADPDTLAQAKAEIPLGYFGQMIEMGAAVGAKEVVFIGGLARPAADELTFDDFTQANFNFAALTQGDDAILRAISDLFAVGGLETIGPLDLIPDLAAPLGPVTRLEPDSAALRDSLRGAEVARALGAVDVGQSVVVQQGLVLAVEGVEGTDALIKRAADLARPGSRPILVKTTKPQQDLRLDTPTFGPGTVASLAAHGYAGAFIEAGKTLLVDRVATVQAADAAGLFIAGIAP